MPEDRSRRRRRRAHRSASPGHRGAVFEALEPRRVLSTAGGSSDPANAFAGTVLVKLRPVVAPPLEAATLTARTTLTAAAVNSTTTAFPGSLAAVLDAVGATEAARVFPTAPAATAPSRMLAGMLATTAVAAEDDVSAAARVGLDRWYSFDIPAGSDLEAVLAALRADDSVEAAEPDFLFKLEGFVDAPLTTMAVVPAQAGIAGLPSGGTDPGYGQQWHLGAVNAPAAWAGLESLGLPAGGRSDIVVAVIDTGVDYRHPDLAANIWVNTRENPGNTVDDDRNGFRDDIHGVSVVGNSTSHSGDPLDDNGHGTHVAGIIAAAAGNGIGGTGIAYNARIMAIKAFQYSGVGAASDIAEGIYYAVENGADVINMSFGSYTESLLVKDALQVAFGRCVLVAAAGNDGRGNLSCPPTDQPAPANMYPAAYNWVLGVMASNPAGGRPLFSNKDCLPGDEHEYELLAPGVAVYSTLPGGTYSAWSGTSMAAPVVSGIAALVRTRFADKDLYSSRFIMGQLAIGRGAVIDAHRALVETPRPSLSYLSHRLFDTTAQDAGNDGDGRVDAGETIDLAITIRNQWGRADDVTVRLDAFRKGAAGPDPYVTMVTDTVAYGAVGTFSQDDNGLILGTDGTVVGVTSPFRFRVAANAPNEHVIPFQITVTARNGLDPADTTTYTFVSPFTLSVQRGRVLPSIIAQDTTLTQDDFWIVEGPVLIPAGVTVRVGPGTQIQWGTHQPSASGAPVRTPYIKVEGTLRVEGSAADPVRLFPSDAHREFPIWSTEPQGFKANVRIYNTHGTTTIAFAEVDAPEFSCGAYGEPNSGQGSDNNRNSFHRLTEITDSVLRGSNGDQHLSLYWDAQANAYLPQNNGFRFAARTIRNTRIDLAGVDLQYAFGNSYSSLAGVLVERLTTVRNFAWSQGFVAPVTDSVFVGTAFDPGSRLVFSADHPAVADSEAMAALKTVFQGNALLNRSWDPRPTQWIRLGSAVPRGKFIGIPGNYWGTTSPSVIEQLLDDQVDDFNQARMVYQPPLSAPAATAYPFAWDVGVATDAATGTGQIGLGTATFTVRFNRDMDISVQPQVGFGPAVPYTDYTVQPRGAGWVDPRTWVGEFNVTPLTGDGYQLIRVAGARAADNPWLVTGNDGGRFRFEIVTSGTESMNLQASGGEGRVDLSWTQDDFDLLAGYNIYRATAADGTYARINTTVIPKEQTSYTDTAVQPAQTYYYKFRIVKTDSTESVDSNVAAAMPLDTIPPQIAHTAVTSAAPNFALTLRADVTDNLALQAVTLYYRAIGQSAYVARAMTLTTGNRYSATLDAAVMTAPGVEYYISATDGTSTVYHATASQPRRITVVDQPVVTTITPASGSSHGGTSIMIVGSNFKPGATVSVGGAVAADVVVVSPTQITARTPAGTPAFADVRVSNPDGGAGTLLGGFRYLADGVLVSLPTLATGSGGTVEVPISVANLSGLLGAAVTLTFDPAVLRPAGTRTGTLTTGWSLDTNTATTGRIALALAGATSVSATGTLAVVSFDVVGGPGTSTSLEFLNVSLNDGAIAAQTSAGQVTIDRLHLVSGLVRYYADGAPIPGVTLALTGPESRDATSDAAGSYAFASLRAGDYTLAPGKHGDVRAISAFDAALVLQAVTGRRVLTADEKLAADTNRRDDVTALDASYILQKSVGLIPGTFPNAGVHWLFTPAQRTYTGLASDQVDQRFTGILLGDVSGNWAQQVTGSAQPHGAFRPNTHASGAPVLAVGSAAVRPGAAAARLPVTIERGGTAVYALDLAFGYDASVLAVSPDDVALGPAATGMAMAVNTATPGLIRVALAGPVPLASDGAILDIRFAIPSGASRATDVTVESAALNEDATAVLAAAGGVTIDDVPPPPPNTGPTDIALSMGTVAENQPTGTPIGTFATADPDAGDTFTYALVPGAGAADNAAFTIVGDQLRAARPFNFELRQSHAIRVRSTDAGGLSTEKAFTITVVDVANEPFVVEAVSLPAAGSYGAGQRIRFVVTLSTVAAVAGKPQFEVRVGSAARAATYVSGAGSPLLAFEYVVTATDSADAVAIGQRFVLAKKSGISAGAQNIPVALPAAIAGATASGVRLDGQPPRVSGSVSVPANGTYTEGQALDFLVRFTEPVVVVGVPQIALSGLNGPRVATYVSGGGGSQLTFRYVVRAGDALSGKNGLALAKSITLPAGALISDVAGNRPALKITAPSLKGIRIAAAAASALGGDGERPARFRTGRPR